METESKDYSWKWVTADEILSHGPCELLYAQLLVSAASTDSYLYDGNDATGTVIAQLASSVVIGTDLVPPKPIFCRKGLFVDVGTNVTGIFVMWREL